MLVKVRGWRPGLIAIDLIKVFQRDRGLGLIEARDMAHAIIDDKPFDFEFESATDAKQFRDRLEKLGVITID